MIGDCLVTISGIGLIIQNWPDNSPSPTTFPSDPPPLNTPPFEFPPFDEDFGLGDFGDFAPIPGFDHPTVPPSFPPPFPNNDDVFNRPLTFPGGCDDLFPPFFDSGSDDVIDDLFKRSTPGRKTKGRTLQRDIPGGLQEANDAFDALNPSNVKQIDTPFGPGRVGQLPDGRTVIVRSGSSNDGPPTLEIQKGKKKIKFRFGD